jgi:hypothetical protein
MNKIKLYFLSAVVIIASLAIGVVAGMLLQNKISAPRVKQMTETVGSLSSKVVSAVVAFGSVESIDNNRNITLAYNGDKMTVAIGQDAKIYFYENSVKKELQFQDVKMGDLVNITTTVSQDGKLQGNMIVIFTRAQ